MATAFRTPLSPAPRYAAPQRPRFNTNPSLGGLHSPPLRSGRGRSSLEHNAIPDTTIDDRIAVSSTNGIHAVGEEPIVQDPPTLPERPAKPTRPIPSVPDMHSVATPMLVDPAPTPSPAISTNAITGFPLPPVRDSMPLLQSGGNQSSASVGTSSSGHTSTLEATTSRIRPLPPRPGPPKPELVPEWEPDVKKHIPEEATLDSRIASYARLSEPPPKLRSQILARERGVTAELKEHDRLDTRGAVSDRRGLQISASGSVPAGSDEREKLGMLRQPAVNGLIRIEKSANLNGNKSGPTMMGDMSRKGKGKMRDQAIGILSDLSGIAGEWALDPSLARLGSAQNGHHAGRPSLDTNGSSTAYSTRTASSATGSRNSLFPASSEQGHSLHSINSGSTLAMQDDPMNSSIWKKRKRFSQNAVHDGKNESSAPAAVFETDKGNIDVRLAIVDDGARSQAVSQGGNTLIEQYMGSSAIGGTAKKGLLNAKSQDTYASPAVTGVYQTERSFGETCARVEILTRKGNVRVELPEIQRGRQAALQITSRDGNIFLSLPENFVGPIQCSTAPNQSVLLLPSLRSRVETLYEDRGESLFYLGQRPSANDGNAHPPILPPRRLSNRLRRMSQGNAIPSHESNPYRPTVESPSAMEIDSPLLLPSAYKITNSSALTFIPHATRSPKSATEHPVEAVKESSVYASSYTGSICIGLYGLEPKHVFKGASTLSGLMDGLGEAKKLLKDRIGHQAPITTSSSRHFV